MSALTDGVLHATIGVSSLSKAKGFYSDTLQLTLEEEIPDAGLMYRSAGGGTLQVYESQYAGTSKSTAATFEVRDLDTAMTELRGRGATFEDYDQPGLKTTDGVFAMGDFRGCWIKDPDGNILSIVQRG